MKFYSNNFNQDWEVFSFYKNFCCSNSFYPDIYSEIHKMFLRETQYFKTLVSI